MGKFALYSVSCANRSNFFTVALTSVAALCLQIFQKLGFKRDRGQRASIFDVYQFNPISQSWSLRSETRTHLWKFQPVCTYTSELACWRRWKSTSVLLNDIITFSISRSALINYL